VLVVEGFLESDVFVPEKPLANIKGRQKAILRIEGTGYPDEEDRLNGWREFSKAIRTSNETLEGDPGRIRFRSPEETEML